MENSDARAFHADPLLDDQADMNALADRIDMNHLMARVDWNTLLHLSKAKTPQDPFLLNGAFDHPSMDNVKLQPRAGFTTELLDALRCLAIDRDLTMASWLQYARRASRMPPTPYDGPEEQQHIRNPGKDNPELPARLMHRAVALQECYSGFVSKTMAVGLDIIFLLVTFMLAHMIFAYARKLCLGGPMNAMVMMLSPPGMELFWASIGYGTYWFWYYLLTTWLVGKTFGMHVFGLEIVIDRRSDKRSQLPLDEGISFWRAFFRTVALPLGPLFVPVTFWRRDGRMWQDLVAGTGVVYSWDADAALYRQDAKLGKRLKKMNLMKRGLMAPLLDPDSADFAEP